MNTQPWSQFIGREHSLTLPECNVLGGRRARVQPEGTLCSLSPPIPGYHVQGISVQLFTDFQTSMCIFGVTATAAEVS